MVDRKILLLALLMSERVLFVDGSKRTPLFDGIDAEEDSVPWNYDNLNAILKGGHTGKEREDMIQKIGEVDSLDSGDGEAIIEGVEEMKPTELDKIYTPKSYSPMTSFRQAAYRLLIPRTNRPKLKAEVSVEEVVSTSGSTDEMEASLKPNGTETPSLNKMSPRSLDSGDSIDTLALTCSNDSVTNSPIQSEDKLPRDTDLTRRDSSNFLLGRTLSLRTDVSTLSSRAISTRTCSMRIASVRLNKNIKLPDLYLDESNEAYEDEVAACLYSLPGENFHDVTNVEYSMMAKMLPVFRTREGTRFVHEVIAEDIVSEAFKSFLAVLFEGKEEDVSEELVNESIQTLVWRAIGKACSLSEENVYKLGEAPQRVLLTERDLVYYPGMLRLAALFGEIFDPNRANGFFYQFLRTFYSGVYGPKRRDLNHIARIEDIPARVMSDRLLNGSLGRLNEEETESANASISAIRETYLNPEYRELLMTNRSAQITLRELDPVPKTLEDVLEATELILNATCGKGNKRLASLRENLYDPVNVNHLQSFFLTVFKPLDAKILLDSLLFSMMIEKVAGFRDHAAAFLYAAWLLALEAVGNVDQAVTVVSIQQKLAQILRTRVRIEELNRIHERSVRVANINLP